MHLSGAPNTSIHHLVNGLWGTTYYVDWSGQFVMRLFQFLLMNALLLAHESAKKRELRAVRLATRAEHGLLLAKRLLSSFCSVVVDLNDELRLTDDSQQLRSLLMRQGGSLSGALFVDLVHRDYRQDFLQNLEKQVPDEDSPSLCMHVKLNGSFSTAIPVQIFFVKLDSEEGPRYLFGVLEDSEEVFALPGARSNIPLRIQRQPVLVPAQGPASGSGRSEEEDDKEEEEEAASFESGAFSSRSSGGEDESGASSEDAAMVEDEQRAKDKLYICAMIDANLPMADISPALRERISEQAAGMDSFSGWMLPSEFESMQLWLQDTVHQWTMLGPSPARFPGELRIMPLDPRKRWQVTAVPDTADTVKLVLKKAKRRAGCGSAQRLKEANQLVRAVAAQALQMRRERDELCSV